MKKLATFALITLFFSVYPLIAGAEVILSEDFSNGLPDTWNVVDGYSDGHTWTNLFGPFMIAYSSQAGQDIIMDEQLITPKLDCSQAEIVYLIFSWEYASFSLSDYVTIDVQVANRPWVTLKKLKIQENNKIYFNTCTINASMAAGETDVRFRFYYHKANYEYYILIDNVYVTNKIPLDQYEVDNTWEQATPLAFSVSQEHTICPAADQDWFKFTLDQESWIRLETSVDEDTYTFMQLYQYNSDLNELTELDSDDDSGDGFSSLIGMTLPGGTYYVSINEYNEDKIGSYTISLHTMFIPEPDPTLGSRVIYENWECGVVDTSVWIPFGYPASTVESKLGCNNSYGLNPNGDDYCDSGLISAKTFDLSRGLRLRWKMRSVYDEAYDIFQIISFGIKTGEKGADSVCPDEEYVSIATASIRSSTLNRSLSFSIGGSEIELNAERWHRPFPGNIWIEAETVIHKDGKISFWLDGKLEMVTSKAIDFSQIQYKYDMSRVQIMGRNLWRESPKLPIIDDIEVYTDVDQESPSPPQEPLPDGSLPLMQKEIPGYAGHSMVPVYLESGSAASPYLADIDGDGDLDLILARAGDEIVLFTNTGTKQVPNWSVGENNFIAQGETKITAPCLADIDRDGDLDGFFVISGRLDFYRNKGSEFEPSLELEKENFILPSIEDEKIKIVNIRLADMDADGDLDIFLSLTDWRTDNNLPRIEIYRNNGTANQHSFQLYKVITELWDGDADFINVADVDGDNDFDILLGYAIVEEHLGIIENIGSPENPEWAAERSWLSCPGTRHQQITHGDLDGDGRIELLVGLGDGRLMLYKQKSPFGINNWEQTVSPYLSQDVGEESVPCLVDFDGDGDLDMIVGSFSGNISWFENQGTILKPYWASSIILSDLPDDLRAVAPACGDLDGDGDMDILLGDLNGTLTACWNDGTADQPVWGRIDREFRDLKVDSRSAPGLGDVDQDGDLDLLIGNACGTVAYYENIGGKDTVQWEIREESLADLNVGYAARPVLIDMDEDKDLDILVGGLDGYLAYIRNDGVANLPQFVQDGCNVLPEAKQLMSAPAGGDIDNDGDIDLLFGEKDGGITFFRNLSPKLSISPNIITMLQETSQQFEIRGLSGLDALDCSIIRNQSAGVLTVVDDTTVSYMAGPTGGTNVVDVIEIKDSLTGLYIRAHINVIGPGDVESIGQAIILAGRRSEQDALQGKRTWITVESRH